MAEKIKPESELIVGGLAATVVYSIFALNAPNMADVRQDDAGNENTYKAVNTATITAAAVVAGMAFLTRSPTVLVIGGTMTLIEAWKYHFANYGAHRGKTVAQVQAG